MLRDFWTLAKPYWTSEERGKAWAMGSAAVVLNLVNIFVLTRITAANGVVGDALQDKNGAAFTRGAETWVCWVAVWITVYVYATYFQQLLGLRWRQWMTRHLLQLWLSNKTYYYWRFAGQQAADNPDQRIAEDVQGFIDHTLNLVLGLIASIAVLATYTVILWGLSSGLRIPISGRNVAIPGYLVWVALVWSALFSWFTHTVGKKLIPRNATQQKYEADFRFRLIRVRENGESIALSQGETAENRTLDYAFGSIAKNFLGIMSVNKAVNAVSQVNNYLGAYLPMFLAAPLYFRGLIKIGGLFKINGSFGYVQGAFSFLVSSYAEIALWLAIIRRLTGFLQTVEQTREMAGGQSLSGRGIVGQKNHDGFRPFPFRFPTVNYWRRTLNWYLPPATRCSSVVPAVRGNPRFCERLPASGPMRKAVSASPKTSSSEIGAVMVLPQKPYLPVGTLRAAFAYPLDPAALHDIDWASLLKKVRLAHLLPRLDEDENWSQILSGGEQQRVAFARGFPDTPTLAFSGRSDSGSRRTHRSHVVQRRSRRTARNGYPFYRASQQPFHPAHEPNHVLEWRQLPAKSPRCKTQVHYETGGTSKWATTQVPKDEWKTFLDDFTRKHVGKKATAELYGRGVFGSNDEAHALAFSGVTLEEKGKRCPFRPRDARRQREGSSFA